MLSQSILYHQTYSFRHYASSICWWGLDTMLCGRKLLEAPFQSPTFELFDEWQGFRLDWIVKL